jgi:putative transposase
VKTVEESSRICGYDAHTHIKGRKRHLLVDTLGIPLSIYVTPADTHDTRVSSLSASIGSRSLCRASAKIWADAASARAGGGLSGVKSQEIGNWRVVERPSGTRGFSVVPAPDGWWSEHSVGFLAHRSMRKDDERHPCLPCETLIQVATSRLLLARLERKS